MLMASTKSPKPHAKPVNEALSRRMREVLEIRELSQRGWALKAVCRSRWSAR